MELNSSDKEKRQSAYSTQFFDFTPDAFVDSVTTPALDVVNEHLEAAKKMDRESHMIKHWFHHHQHHEDQDPPQFSFSIIGSYKDCMSRQVKEAVRIQNRPNSLNSKGEYGGGTITRLTVEKNKFEKKKTELEERRK